MSNIEVTKKYVEREVTFITRYKGNIVNVEPVSKHIDDGDAVSVDNDIGFYGRSSMGALLLDAGKITVQEAEEIISLQEEEGLRFGDAAKQFGLISEADIQKALSQQFDFPYIAASDDVFSQDIIAAYQPYCKQVEALRAVRSQLMLRWFNDDRKMLSIVSPDRNEGRSYISANLAVVFSQLGKKTLLVDANLRDPKQHELFKLEQKKGLSDLLAGRADQSVIYKSPQFHNLSILPAGTIPPNPAEMISRGLNIILQRLSQEYDVILVDTPAIQNSTEAQIIAAHCGGSLIVSRQDHTRMKDLETMKAGLEQANIQCLGVVINEY